MNGVRTACGAEHALEIVAHWLASGSVDLTFTSSGEHHREILPPKNENLSWKEMDQAVGLHKPIGEIVINRDGVHNILADDPQALASVLDSLFEAMVRHAGLGKKPAPEKMTARPRIIA